MSLVFCNRNKINIHRSYDERNKPLGVVWNLSIPPLGTYRKFIIQNGQRDSARVNVGENSEMACAALPSARIS